MRDGEGETFCHKAFPSTVLPARIADRLTLRGLSQLVRGRRTRVTGGLRTTPPARSAAS